MSEKTVIEGLLDFGFSKDEAKTYLFLLRSGPCPASVVSRKLGFNRVKAYRILKVLEQRGAVGVVVGRPVRFAATPLQKTTEQLIEEERKKILEMEKSKKEVIKHWKKTQTTVEALEEPRFRILQGRKQIYDFLASMFNRAKAEICLMTTKNDLQRFSFYGLDEKLKNFNHLAKRVLTQVNQHGLETVENSLDFAEVRHVTLPTTVRFVIIDESELLNTFAMDDSMSMTTQKDTGLWTDAYNYVKAMKIFFDSVWRAAPDAREVLDAVRSGKAPQEIKVIGTQEEYNKLCKTMMETSNEEVIVMNKQTGEIPITIQSLQACGDRGVNIRILTKVDLDSFQRINELLKIAQVMHTEALPDLQLLIVDKRKVLVHIPHMETPGYTIWSNLKPQVQTMIQVFESNWNNGVPLQEIVPKLATQQKLTKGLKLAAKSLEVSGWIVGVPGQITTETGTQHSFSLVAKNPNQPQYLVLDMLVSDDALGQIVGLNSKVMEVKPALQLLASTIPFYEVESRLADLYGIKLIYAISPEMLAAKIVNEVNKISKE